MRMLALGAAVVSIVSFSATLSAQTYPIPLVNTPVVPSAVSPRGRSFTLTVNGNGFTSASRVLWNGSARKTKFVSNIQVTATILAKDIAEPTTATVAVANPGENHISNPVFLQVSDPVETIAMTEIDTGLSADGSPLAVDVNGDGIADLIIPEEFAVEVALGLGGGEFSQPQVIPFNSPVYSVIAGNFTPGGKPDLAVVSGRGVCIVPNDGNGVFGTPKEAIPPSSYTMSLAAADVNGDGLLDLVVAESDGNVYVYLRKAHGGFKQPNIYPAGASPNSVAIGDLNRDGNADLAVLNEDDTIAILLGNGDGTFQPATFYSEGSSGDFPGPVIVADFNGDGKLDVARAAADFMAGVGVALGNGDGTLQPILIYQTSSYGLVAGDFNSDRILDVATGLNSPGTGILLGEGNGTFDALYNFGYPNRGEGVSAADFNNNGLLDVAAESYSGTSSSIVLYVH